MAVSVRDRSEELGPCEVSDLDDVLEIEARAFKAPWTRQVFLEEMSRQWAHLDVIRAEEPGLADEVERLIAEREAARRERDFGRADRIRDDLRGRGIALEDSKDGVRWRRISPTEAGRS